MVRYRKYEYLNILGSIGGGAGGSSGGGQNSVSIGQTAPSGTNSVALSAPHIVQYPRPPKRDDGRWIALSSVIGNIIGKLASRSVIKEARDAEDKWREVMKKMKDMADHEVDRVSPLRAKAGEAMSDLDKRNTINWQRADIEYGYGDRLKPCIDNMQDELCALADCGYQPDYDGILTRITADAAVAQQREMEKLCRINGRYNVGWACDVKSALHIATQNAIIANTNKAREEERLKKWQYDNELKHKVFTTMEQARQQRQATSQNYDRTASTVRQQQYTNYTADATNSLKMGADLLAAHGQNAAWLAESLRKTAKETMADWGTLAVMIYTLVSAWNSRPNEAKADDCGAG